MATVVTASLPKIQTTRAKSPEAPSSSSGRAAAGGRWARASGWHGCNAHLPLVDYHAEISKTLGAAADRGYYALLPVGTRSEAAAGSYGRNSDGILCGGPRVDDFAFFEALLDFASTDLCVDTERIYSTGFSTGAFLTYGAACRWPSLLAAVR